MIGLWVGLWLWLGLRVRVKVRVRVRVRVGFRVRVRVGIRVRIRVNLTLTLTLTKTLKLNRNLLSYWECCQNMVRETKFASRRVHICYIGSYPSRTTTPLIRPRQCDSEGGRIRGVLL